MILMHQWQLTGPRPEYGLLCWEIKKAPILTATFSNKYCYF
jgi:hypothetical protein